MCECNLCKRNREFHDKIKDLDHEVKEYLQNFMDYVMGIELDNECYQIYLENLKVKYPDVYKEVKTLEKVKA